MCERRPCGAASVPEWERVFCLSPLELSGNSAWPASELALPLEEALDGRCVLSQRSSDERRVRDGFIGFIASINSCVESYGAILV